MHRRACFILATLPLLAACSEKLNNSAASELILAAESANCTKLGTGNLIRDQAIALSVWANSFFSDESKRGLDLSYAGNPVHGVVLQYEDRDQLRTARYTRDRGNWEYASLELCPLLVSSIDVLDITMIGSSSKDAEVIYRVNYKPSAAIESMNSLMEAGARGFFRQLDQLPMSLERTARFRRLDKGGWRVEQVQTPRLP